MLDNLVLHWYELRQSPPCLPWAPVFSSKMTFSSLPWQIWEDILGFQNAEFYFKRWPQLDGTRFEDVLVSFPDAVPVGVKVASAGGKIVLNPEDEYVLSVGDELLVLAEDDDTYSPGPAPEVLSGTCIHSDA